MMTCERAVRWRAVYSLACLAITATLPASAQGKDDEPGALKFAVVLARHGVRSPTGSIDDLSQYSAQPWPKWEVPPGYLTPHGAQLMKSFGGYYRSYFAEHGLLTEAGCADATHVSVYSDSDQRTVETGKALSSGMFPGCKTEEHSEQHALGEGEADPLFHSLSAGVGQPDRERAIGSIAGRIGGSPGNVTEAYRPQLEALQRILLGCRPDFPCPQPGHTANKLLLNIPATLSGGKSDHLAELKGPLNTASTITENFLLEYANGMPIDQVGWGGVDLTTLKQLIGLHTEASDLTRRSFYLASVQASNPLAHILKTLQQAATEKPVSGALGKPGDRLVLLVGHDTNLSNLAGMLDINWIVDGRKDDTPPGGALVFELWQRSDSVYEVRAYYIAQTLEQMRNATALTLKTPPARANVFIPGCSSGGPSFACDWKQFQTTLTTLINPAFVR